MSTFKTSSAKENILRKIRTALHDVKIDKPYPELGKINYNELYAQPNPEEDLASVFVEEFTKAGGKFVYSENAREFVDNLYALADQKGWKQVACAHKDLFAYLVAQQVPFVRELNPKNDAYDACITDCEIAVARTGSFLFSSQQNFGRTAPVYYPVHIIVLQPHQIVQDISDALKVMKQKYQQVLPSMINLNTGPSRTADIEKTLVTGIHGPKEIYCFWMNS